VESFLLKIVHNYQLLSHFCVKCSTHQDLATLTQLNGAYHRGEEHIFHGQQMRYDDRGRKISSCGWPTQPRVWWQCLWSYNNEAFGDDTVSKVESWLQWYSLLPLSKARRPSGDIAVQMSNANDRWCPRYALASAQSSHLVRGSLWWAAEQFHISIYCGLDTPQEVGPWRHAFEMHCYKIVTFSRNIKEIRE
jgi:hypothetical protein